MMLGSKSRDSISERSSAFFMSLFEVVFVYGFKHSSLSERWQKPVGLHERLVFAYLQCVGRTISAIQLQLIICQTSLSATSVPADNVATTKDFEDSSFDQPSNRSMLGSDKEYSFLELPSKHVIGNVLVLYFPKMLQ